MSSRHLRLGLTILGVFQLVIVGLMLVDGFVTNGWMYLVKPDLRFTAHLALAFAMLAYAKSP